ncbi:MAG: hypothetical protein PHE49_07575 [bacterium]|nr:hypothetical protein [bacterium]
MKTIIWDIDDVLNDLMKSWFENIWLPSNPGCRLSYKNLTSNPPNELLNLQKEDYFKLLDEYRNSNKANNMKPDEKVIKWFEKYGENFRHIALTARPTHTVSAVAEWVLCYFGKWIRTISFIPSGRPNIYMPTYDKGKVEYLKWFGKADFFIDDKTEDIEGAKKLGIKSYLVAQPWNNGKLTLPMILDLLTKNE